MKFIHFGCWNNGECNQHKPEQNGLSNMMHKLNKVVKTHKLEFMIVAGDNYYPQKINDNIWFNPRHFYSGFECLPPTIPKYVLLGNHDMEDVVQDIDTMGPAKLECHALLLQQKMKDITLFNNVIHFVKDGTLFIMIDTTMYNLDKKKNKNKSINIDKPINTTCYKHIFDNYKDPNITLVSQLITYQNNQVRDILRTYENRHIVIAGHHPICHIKSKGKDEDNVIVGLLSLFQQNTDLLNGKNIYYLCADTHLYQVGIVRTGPLIIHQYIVGTGGAQLDDNPIEQNIATFESGSYTISQSLKTNGFIICETTMDGLKIDFIQSHL
jgi:hypothetical protein